MQRSGQVSVQGMTPEQVEQHQQHRELGAAALCEHGHLRGSLALPSGARVVCGGFLSRYEDLDTLELYLPLGALARVDRRIGGYPFDEHSGVASLTWRAGLDRWLADVATAVHADVPFQRALIGFEIDVEKLSLSTHAKWGVCWIVFIVS